jgi:stearoyl-CoA desaturase (delta-9 desaturase)
VLATLQRTCGKDLDALRGRSNATTEHWCSRLDDWCHRAEASGIDALVVFSRRLRTFRA